LTFVDVDIDCVAFPAAEEFEFLTSDPIANRRDRRAFS
jgi:hypothetical protein